LTKSSTNFRDRGACCCNNLTKGGSATKRIDHQIDIRLRSDAPVR
jgi:hypothetical protein